MLVKPLRIDLRVQGTKILALVQELVNLNTNPPLEYVQSPLEPAANTVVQYNVQIEILILLRNIAQNRGDRGGQGGRGGRGGARGDRG